MSRASEHPSRATLRRRLSPRRVSWPRCCQHPLELRLRSTSGHANDDIYVVKVLESYDYFFSSPLFSSNNSKGVKHVDYFRAIYN
jgi:hypothetical protein